DGLTCGDEVYELGGTMALVVVENADDAIRMAQLQTLGQGEEPACVLGGDDIGGFDRLPHPRTRIAEVADRSSDQDESPAGRVTIASPVAVIGRGGLDGGVASVVLRSRALRCPGHEPLAPAAKISANIPR